MVISAVVVVVVIYFIYYQMYHKRKDLPPGPAPWPIVGNMFQLDPKRPEKSLLNWRETYGPVFTVWLPAPHVFVVDYDLLKEAFIKQGEAFSGRPDFALNTSLYKGNYGLFFSIGPIWKENRRFTLHTLRDFGFGRNTLEPQIMDQARELIAMLQNTKEPINIRDPLLTASGNVINLLVFNYAFKFDDPNLARFKDIFEEYSAVASSPAGMLIELYPWIRHLDGRLLNLGWRQLMVNYYKLFDFVAEEVQKHKESLNVLLPPRDYTDAYLIETMKREKVGEGDLFNDWQIVTAINDLWSAGFETIVTTLQWGILYLLNYPSIQDKLHEEIDRVVGSDHVLSMDDQRRLPYLSATVQEMQRLSNIVPIVPHALIKDAHLNGYKIPKDTIVIPQWPSLHVDPKIFKDPEQFRPERFIDDETGRFIKSEYVMPFSLGKRACVGEHLAQMQLFLFLGTLMQHCHFRPVDEGHPPPIDYVPGMVRSPIPFMCRVAKRNSAS